MDSKHSKANLNPANEIQSIRMQICKRDSKQSNANSNCSNANLNYSNEIRNIQHQILTIRKEFDVFECKFELLEKDSKHSYANWTSHKEFEANSNHLNEIWSIWMYILTLKTDSNNSNANLNPSNKVQSI